MPLTYGSGYLEALARRRAQMEEGRAGMERASQLGIGALGAFGQQQHQAAQLRLEQAKDARAAEQTKFDNERRLRLDTEDRAQRDLENKRADEGLRLRLEQENRLSEAMRNSATASAAETQRRADALAADIERKAQADRYAEEERGRKENLDALKSRIRAMGGEIDPDALTATAEEFGVTEDDVKVMIQDVQAETNARDLERRKTEADITKKSKVGAGGGKKSGDKRTTAERKEDADTASMLDQVARIRALKDGVKTNFAKGTKMKVQGYFGMGTPAEAAFRAEVGSLVSAYIKLISGATVSEPERIALMQNVPNLTDSDDVFTAKLDRMEQAIQREASVRQATRGYGAPAQAPAPSGSTITPRGRDMSADDFLGGP